MVDWAGRRRLPGAFALVVDPVRSFRHRATEVDQGVFLLRQRICVDEA